MIGAYVYKAPLPELPMDISGCQDNVANNIIGGFKMNEIDLVHPVLVGDVKEEVMSPEVDDW